MLSSKLKPSNLKKINNFFTTSSRKGSKRRKNREEEERKELSQDTDEMMDIILPKCIPRPNVYFHLSETVSKWILIIENVDDNKDLQSLMGGKVQTQNDNESTISMISNSNDCAFSFQRQRSCSSFILDDDNDDYHSFIEKTTLRSTKSADYSFPLMQETTLQTTATFEDYSLPMRQQTKSRGRSKSMDHSFPLMQETSLPTISTFEEYSLPMMQQTKSRSRSKSMDHSYPLTQETALQTTATFEDYSLPMAQRTKSRSRSKSMDHSLPMMQLTPLQAEESGDCSTYITHQTMQQSSKSEDYSLPMMQQTRLQSSKSEDYSFSVKTTLRGSKSEDYSFPMKKQTKLRSSKSSSFLQEDDEVSLGNDISQGKKEDNCSKSLPDFNCDTFSLDEIENYFAVEDEEQKDRKQRDLEKENKRKERQYQQEYLEKEHEELIETYEKLARTKRRLSGDHCKNDTYIDETIKKPCGEICDSDAATEMSSISCLSDKSSKDESTIKDVILTNLPSLFKRGNTNSSKEKSKNSARDKGGDNKIDITVQKKDENYVSGRVLNEDQMEHLARNNPSANSVEEIELDVKFLRHEILQLVAEKCNTRRRIRDTINSLIQQLESDIRIYYMIQGNNEKKIQQKEWNKDEDLLLKLLDNIEERILLLKKQQQRNPAIYDKEEEMFPYARVYNQILNQYLAHSTGSIEEDNHYRWKCLEQQATSEIRWKDVELVEELISMIVSLEAQQRRRRQRRRRESNSSGIHDAASTRVIKILESIRDNCIAEAQELSEVEARKGRSRVQREFERQSKKQNSRRVRSMLL